MSSKVFVATLTLLLTCGLGSAVAAPYLSVNLGAVQVDDASFSAGGDTLELSTDPGVVITAAIGNSYQQMRAEVEFAYRASDNDKFSAFGNSLEVDGEYTATSLMFNAYLDLASGSPITPFIGGGVGFAQVESEIIVFGESGKGDDNVVAYQLIGGLSLPVTPTAAFDLQYRYFATEDPEIDGVTTEYASHNLMAGLRLTF